MSLLLFVYAYATVAFFVGGYAYFRGVVARPMPKELAFEDRAVLSIAAAGVGLLWVLFMPALAAWWAIRLARLTEAHLARVPLRTPGEARARG